MIPTPPPGVMPEKELRECLRPYDHRYFQLIEDWPVVYHYEGRWYRFWLRTPWDYDVASIPRLFWPITSPLELGFEAPAAHDHLLEQKGLVEVEVFDLNSEWSSIGEIQFTRLQVDRFFAMKMRTGGISMFRRRTGYRGVRLWARLKPLLGRGEW